MQPTVALHLSLSFLSYFSQFPYAQTPELADSVRRRVQITMIVQTKKEKAWAPRGGVMMERVHTCHCKACNNTIYTISLHITALFKWVLSNNLPPDTTQDII